MNWTDERVELLRRLWNEGLSASQIAAELGGVSRNAVIGKVHRLKLSGRGKTTKATSRLRKTTAVPQPRPTKEMEEPLVARAALSNSTRNVSTSALKVEAVVPVETHLETRDIENVVVPLSKHLNLLQLSETTCKWPVGDPLSEEFYFCGADAGEASPYCSYHSRLAFQPLSDRRRKAS